MSTNQQSNEEEVDLGSLFQIIGKGFSNFFNFIGNIFKEIFHYFILILLFLRKNTLLISIAAVLGGLVGFFIELNDKEVYESSLIIEPNFNSTKQLYSNLEYYNHLIYNNDTLEIAEKFNLESTFSTLKSFEINPIKNSNDILIAYDEVLKLVDTASIKNITFEEFKGSFTDFDYSLFEVKVKSTDKRIFQNLSEIIVNDLESNSYLTNLKNNEKNSLVRNDSIYRKVLESIDTLSSVYQKVLIEESKKAIQGTSINLEGKNGDKIRELELLKLRKDYNNLLNLNSDNLVRKSSIVNVVSDFQKIGIVSTGILKKKSVQLALLFVGLTIMILLLIKLNKYLKDYQKN